MSFTQLSLMLTTYITIVQLSKQKLTLGIHVFTNFFFCSRIQSRMSYYIQLFSCFHLLLSVIAPTFSLFLITLTLLNSTGQIFCKISLILGLSNGEEYHIVIWPSHCVRLGELHSLCIIACNMNLGHLIQLVTTSFLTDITIFFFLYLVCYK